MIREQVESIAAAAEASAAEVQREATARADQHRDMAAGAADRTLRSIGKIERELGDLLQDVRAQSDALRAVVEGPAH